MEDEVERDVDITDLKIYSDYFDDPSSEARERGNVRTQRPQTLQLDFDEDYYDQDTASAPLLRSQQSTTSTDSSLLQL